MAEKLFRIYECYPDGSDHDTGKTIKCNYDYDVVMPIFQTYGFGDKYRTNYNSRQIDSNIHISYCYPDGLRDTWILKPETEDEGDDR
jgi:hypothetical protein